MNIRVEKLVGRTIEGIQRSEYEGRGLVTLILDNGAELTAFSDEEQNGAGALYFHQYRKIDKLVV